MRDSQRPHTDHGRSLTYNTETGELTGAALMPMASKENWSLQRLYSFADVSTVLYHLLILFSTIASRKLA